MIVLTASALAQTATPNPTPERLTRIYYPEVLDKFRFGKGKRPSNAEINAELINELKSREVHIVLDDSRRKELIEAGASDELIRIIDNALTDVEKRKVAEEVNKIDEMNRLYQIVLDNYKSTDAKQYMKAVGAANEFFERFENEEIAKDVVNWLKAHFDDRRKCKLRRCID